MRAGTIENFRALNNLPVCQPIGIREIAADPEDKYRTADETQRHAKKS